MNEYRNTARTLILGFTAVLAACGGDDRVGSEKQPVPRQQSIQDDGPADAIAEPPEMAPAPDVTIDSTPPVSSSTAGWMVTIGAGSCRDARVIERVYVGECDSEFYGALDPEKTPLAQEEVLTLEGNGPACLDILVLETGALGPETSGARISIAPGEQLSADLCATLEPSFWSLSKGALAASLGWVELDNRCPTAPTRAICRLDVAACGSERWQDYLSDWNGHERIGRERVVLNHLPVGCQDIRLGYCETPDAPVTFSSVILEPNNIHSLEHDPCEAPSLEQTR